MPWSCFNCFRSQSADIKLLNYQHCTLNDVPAEVFAFERTLEELYLDSNRIRDLPRPLFHCHGLKVLSLSDNEVHSLPPAIASLINLNHLDVSRNALNSIPDNLKGCKHLTYVDVSVNPLERLPEGFTQLISLEELYLNDTYLDFLPANFGRLLKLRILELRENNLNTLPKSIARLTHLQRLDIGQNDFSDLPEVIGSLVNLTELWVDSNRIRCLPTFIGNLKRLIHLEASNNNISWIAGEIEHCSKLVDLTVSCNELREIPESIGNLKELVTLKLDDNQISLLPNTIGELSKLEELIVSQNDLENLNPYIGLLRKLHILNIDDNMLEELPCEIGSCSLLTILSAHSNKLQWVPAELGHLSNLRVLNLSENQLRSLPVSVLNLVNLTALWLSNNQSTPLTTLQQEVDKETGQTVCVNFMLPQSTQETYFHDTHHGRCDISSEEQPTKTKQHITFATDADIEAPSRLMRAPTPYPKELRAMAKHARAIHHPRKPSRENDEDIPLLGEMVSQEPKDILIKEAKVKKPGTTSTGEQQARNTSLEKTVETSENDLHFKGEKVVPQYEPIIYQVLMTGDEDGPVVAADSGPVVREAKCVRKLSIPIPIPHAEVQQRASLSSNCEYLQQPPPYHIAAAYSKQAAFFRQVDPQNKGQNILHLNCEDKSNNIICSNKEGFENTQPPNNDLFSAADSKKCDDAFFLREEGRCTPAVIEHANDVRGYLRGENKTSLTSTPLSERSNPAPNTFIFTDEVDESDDTLNESLSVFENRSQLQFQLSLSNHSKANQLDVSGQDNSQSYIQGCSENGESGRKYQSKDENGLLESLDHQHIEQQVQESEEFLMQKPQTFTQDKPVASEGVIAPTPHRPGSPSTPGSPLIDSGGFLTSTSDVDSSPQNNIHLRKPSGIPKSIPKPTSRIDPASPDSGPVKANDSYDQKQSQNFWQSPVSTRIPQPGFYANSPSSHISSRRSSVSSSTTRPGSVASSCDVSCNINEKQKMLPSPDLYRKPSQNNFINPIENILNSDNGDMVIREAIYTPSKIPTYSEISPLRSPRSLPGAQSRIPAPTKFTSTTVNANLRTRADLQGKQTKTWMFGPHRNATVFPVTIQKNPGLGFSISGGTKSSPNDKHELEIFVTKVHPGGPASGLLLPGDKILEVDGIDFNKLEHDQAVHILRQTSNMVNMMISRQQT